MLAATRAESGCRLYELYESDAKGRFYECSLAFPYFDQHAASPHFKHLEQNLEELVQESFEVNVLTSIQIGTAAT